jgi:hypothetical protein
MTTPVKDKKRFIRIAATIAAFLGLMLATLIPKFQEKNNRLTSAAQLRSISLALRQYAADYSNAVPELPGAAGLSRLTSGGYLADPRLFLAPADRVSLKNPDRFLTEENTTYAYAGAGLSVSDGESDYPMLFEKPWLMKPPYYVVLFSGEVISGGNMPDVANCEEFIRHLAGDQSNPVWEKILANARAIDRACGR